MISLALDIGNTNAKLGVFENGELIHVTTSSNMHLRETISTVLGDFTVSASIISTVVDFDQNVQKDLEAIGPCLLFSHRATIPLSNRYASPETLGLDRLAAAIGGNALFPGRNLLVVDAGTCITYDFVTKQGEYMGGAISPGLEMRFKALNVFTDRLPHIRLEEQVELLGQTTKTSILSGVINGAVAEVEGIIQRYKDNYPDLLVLLTGGHSQIFETNLKSDIFAASHIVLIGLNQILEHNDGS